MLIKSVIESGPDLVNLVTPITTLATTQVNGKVAANASSFNHDEMQARRLRRQRREARYVRRDTSGWTARMW